MILNQTEWNKNNPEQQFANCAKYDPELQFVIFPPKKMKPLMGSEKMKLFFGNDDNDGPPGASQPKIVFKEPQDKGLQPGSYPKK